MWPPVGEAGHDDLTDRLLAVFNAHDVSTNTTFTAEVAYLQVIGTRA